MPASCTPGNDSRAIAIAAVLAADALTHNRTAEEIGRMAAFFTVLGDTMALLSLDPKLQKCQEQFNP